MIKINLLPRERVRRPALAPRPLVGVAFLAAVAGVVLVWLVYSARIHIVEVQVQEEQQTIEKLKPKVAEVAELQRQISAARRKEQLLRQLQSLRIPWENVLNELRKIMPTDVWLINIQATGDGSLTFVGYGMTYESVARFMVNLDGSPLFRNADLTSGQKQTQGNREVINFTVSARLAPAQKEAGVR